MFMRFALCVLVVFATASLAVACSCGPWSMESQFDGATDVFVGKVIGVEVVGPGCPSSGSLRFKFEKTGYWKGSNGNIAHVDTECSEAMCGYTFALGKEYVVFSSFSSIQTLYTHLCSGTLDLEYAAETLDFLGPALTPVFVQGASWSTIKANY